MMAVEPATNRMRQQFSVKPTGQMPQVPCPDPLNLEPPCQLPNHGFYQSSDALEQLEPPRRAGFLHVVSQLRLQVNTLAQQVGFELGLNIALVTNQHPLNPSHSLPEGFALINGGGGKAKASNNPVCGNAQVPVEPIVSLAFAGTVTIACFALKTATEVRPSKLTDRNRKAINQMYRAAKRSQLGCQSLLNQRFVLS